MGKWRVFKEQFDAHPANLTASASDRRGGLFRFREPATTWTCPRDRVRYICVMDKIVDQNCVDGFVEPLVEWFTPHARDLPWRQNRTPYRVWVAEVMLQQTRVDTVVPYYERFLGKFPTIFALAAASQEDVLKVWEGLGYYARARNLHAAARKIVAENDGRLPGSFKELVKLPGIGRYVGGAIASFAFGEDTVAVDGNAHRVLCRFFCVEDDVGRSAIQRELEGLTRQLLPPGRAGTFNEALIELGAVICTPRMPKCGECPLSPGCQARVADRVEQLPVRGPHRSTPHYDVAAAVTVATDGTVLVAQRNADDMLGGLWEFPGGKRELGETLEECLTREMMEELDIIVEVDAPVIVVDHAYTHFRITLYAFLCRISSGQPRCLDCADFRWVRSSDLDDLPMSVVDRKVAREFQVTSVAGQTGGS